MSAFTQLESQLAARGGVQNPAALAASIGTAKYGKKGMEQRAATGRKRHHTQNDLARQLAGK